MNYQHLHAQPSWRLEHLLRALPEDSQTARRIRIVMATRHEYRPTRQVKRTTAGNWNTELSK